MVSDSFLSRTKHTILQNMTRSFERSACFPVFMKKGEVPGCETRSLRVTRALCTSTAVRAVNGQ